MNRPEELRMMAEACAKGEMAGQDQVLLATVLDNLAELVSVVNGMHRESADARSAMWRELSSFSKKINQVVKVGGKLDGLRDLLNKIDGDNS